MGAPLLRSFPPHRILIWVALILVFGTVARHIKWSALPQVASAFSQMYPRGKAVAVPAGEAVDATRTRLRQTALAAGDAVLHDHCSPVARTAYRDALLALARQRMRDMGCWSDLICNVDSSAFRDVSLNIYGTDTDRKITLQLAKAQQIGGISPGALGNYLFFVGHIAEIGKLPGIVLLDASKLCPNDITGGGS